jgi:hypothetical protein
VTVVNVVNVQLVRAGTPGPDRAQSMAGAVAACALEAWAFSAEARAEQKRVREH